MKQRSDHPRSRGVYLPWLDYNVGDWGSSPLARGLHASGAELKDKIGIIPARAGFTEHHS